MNILAKVYAALLASAFVVTATPALAQQQSQPQQPPQLVTQFDNMTVLCCAGGKMIKTNVD